MAKWIPGAAVFGLLCLMIIPAPGIWGVLIGAACVLAIIVSLCMLVLDRVATRILAWHGRVRQTRRSRARAVHAGSGMTRKV
jgi:O-antigen/teichoic acid export membrane protein